MLKVSHIRIASNTLANIQSKIDWKINRKAYLIGSILPDLNCVYPKHTYDSTIKRFKNRLIKVNKTESNFIKSLTLGIITHYICDYFCYAHNIKINPKHAIYERIMRKHIKMHEELLNNWPNDLKLEWENIKIHITEYLSNMSNMDASEILINIQENGFDHIEYIIEAVSIMHMEYLEHTNMLDTNNWYKSQNKIELDIEYASFMCEKIALLLLNPSLEIGYLSN